MITYEDLTDMGYYDKGQSYSTPMDMVREFKKAAKQPTNIEMSRTLVFEEDEEWAFEARKVEGDPTAELKELCDKVYVSYGYALARGWDLDEALTRVHENIMERMTQDDGTIKRREDGKIIKNPNTPKVQLGDLV